MTLKRGQNDELGLFAWHRQAMRGDDAGRNAVLVACSVDGTAVARYTLESAGPTRIAISGDKRPGRGVLRDSDPHVSRHRARQRLTQARFAAIQPATLIPIQIGVRTT